MNPLKIAALSVSVFVLSFSTVSAHVVVKPSTVGVGAFQTFTIGVPVEKDQATVALRLVVPEGLHHVTPNVKQGWKIETTSMGEGEEAHITEISWTGGSIPPGQRDEFMFSAQAPAQASELQWKAYQTYADGSVVSWDADPSVKSSDFSSSGPYSITKVVDDTSGAMNRNSNNSTALILSIVALVFSVFALSRGRIPAKPKAQ